MINDRSFLIRLALLKRRVGYNALFILVVGARLLSDYRAGETSQMLE